MNEAESLMDWLRHRAIQSGRSYVLCSYQKQFLRMWEKQFGTTSNIPEDFKKEMESIWNNYRREENGGV